MDAFGQTAQVRVDLKRLVCFFPTDLSETELVESSNGRQPSFPDSFPMAFNMMAPLFVKYAAAIFFIKATTAVSTEGNECSTVCNYYEWGRDAQCHGRRLIAVPQECRQAKTLQMQQNRVSQLATDTFTNFTSLKYLHLEGNNLTLQVGAFRSCSTLTKIHLSENYIPSLSQDTLQGLSNVTVMFIDNSHVQDIKHRAFLNLTKLSFLSLRGNQLWEPPCEAFNRENSIGSFYLSNNRISNLPNGCFRDFSKLTQLYLNSNPLGNPNPLAFERLQSLLHLDLQNTSLSVVPTGILSRTSKLQKLYLSFNGIRYLLNRDFSSLMHLQKLYLQHNRIIAIQSRTFEHIHSLQLIDLSYNQIESIGKGTLDNLEQLEDLRLQSNNLTSPINISLADLAGGVKLRLAENPLHCDCSLYPFQYWLQEMMNGIRSEDGDLTMYQAMCESPPESKGASVLKLFHDEICKFPSHSVRTAETTEETRLIGNTSQIQTKSTRLTTNMQIGMVIIMIAVVSTFVGSLFVTKKRNNRFCMRREDKTEPSYKKKESGIKVTINPVATALSSTFGVSSLGQSSTQGAPHVPTETKNSDVCTGYVSCLDESKNRSSSLVLFHPSPPSLPPGSIPNSPCTSPEPAKSWDSEVIYTSVRSDDVISLDEDYSNMPNIEDWLKKNCRFSPNTLSTSLALPSEIPRPNESTGYIPFS